MRIPIVVAVALVFAACSGSCTASAQSAQAPSSDLAADLIAQLDDAANKIVQLAEVIPQEKYAWRPAEGVRSVSEVLIHVTGGNYYIPSFAGVKGPGVLPRDAEKSITEKAQVIDHVKRSFEHVRSALRATSAADFDKPAKMFGRETTCRNVYLTTVMHAHEHLGQLIAYARTNGIVPPWSAASGD